MARTVELRERLLERVPEGGTKPTLTDMLTKACAAALVRNRQVNAHFVGDEVHRFPSADIGIAVAAPDGLIVPVIRACERRTLAEIAAARADVVGRAREQALKHEDSRGGHVHDLEPRHVRNRPVHRRPEPAPGGDPRGRRCQRATARNDGDFIIRPTMTATLTCDHRAVDGAPRGRFLEDLQAFLEEPGLLV